MPSGQKEPRCRQGERSWGQPAHRCKHEITTYNSKQVLIEESSPVTHNSEQENKGIHSYSVRCYRLDFRLEQWAEGLNCLELLVFFFHASKSRPSGDTFLPPSSPHLSPCATLLLGTNITGCLQPQDILWQLNVILSRLCLHHHVFVYRNIIYK